MKRSPILPALFITALLPLTVNAQYGRVARQFRDRLPRIDAVELQKLKPADFGFNGTLEINTFEGEEAQRIASLWRRQRFHSMAAFCHEPVFGIKFFSKGKTVMHASICWECNNVLIVEPTLKSNRIQGFSAESKLGQQLLAEFKRLYP